MGSVTEFERIDAIVRIHEGAVAAAIRAVAPHLPPIQAAPFDQRIRRGGRNG